MHNKLCDTSRPWIDINVMTLIGADFACACVLISFGVVIGTTSPLQLVIMTMIEVSKNMALRSRLELETNLREDFKITEKAPTKIIRDGRFG